MNAKFKNISLALAAAIFVWLLLQILPGGGLIQSIFISMIFLIFFATLLVASAKLLYISATFLYGAFTSLTTVTSKGTNTLLDILSEALGATQVPTTTRVKLAGLITSVMTRITNVRYTFSAIGDSLVPGGFVIDAQSLQQQSLLAFDEFLRSNRQRTSPERAGIVAGFFVRAFIEGVRLLKVTAKYCLSLLEISNSEDCLNDGIPTFVQAGIHSLLGDTRDLLKVLRSLAEMDLPSIERIPMEVRLEKTAEADWYEQDSNSNRTRRNPKTSKSSPTGGSFSTATRAVEVNPEQEAMEKVVTKLKPFFSSPLFRLNADYDKDCCPLSLDEMGSLAKLPADSDVVLKFNFLFAAANSGGSLTAFNPFYPNNFAPIPEMDKVADYSKKLEEYAREYYSLDMTTSSLTVSNEIAQLILGVKITDLLEALVGMKDKETDSVENIGRLFGSDEELYGGVILLYCKYLRALAEVLIRAKSMFLADGYDSKQLYPDAVSAVIVLHLSLEVSAPSRL